jgi:hypothetical protein
MICLSTRRPELPLNLEFEQPKSSRFEVGIKRKRRREKQKAGNRAGRGTDCADRGGVVPVPLVVFSYRPASVTVSEAAFR